LRDDATGQTRRVIFLVVPTSEVHPGSGYQHNWIIVRTAMKEARGFFSAAAAGIHSLRVQNPDIRME
jgi:hypothetical protein